MLSLVGEAQKIKKKITNNCIMRNLENDMHPENMTLD